MMRGRSTCWQCLSSASSAEWPSAVMGIMSSGPEPPIAAEHKIQVADRTVARSRDHDLALPMPPHRPARHRVGHGRKLSLQRTHLEVPPEIGLYTLRCGDGP